MCFAARAASSFASFSAFFDTFFAAFAAAMHLDYGGLDILRDRHDGRIYIVDANKTDMGPPAAMRGQDKLTAMRALAEAFAAAIDAKLAE